MIFKYLTTRVISWVLLLSGFLLTGCSTVKVDHTVRTHIETRSQKINLAPSSEFIRHQEPDYLTFEELDSLVFNPHPGGYLQEKLDAFWRTPLIDNQAFYLGHLPTAASNTHLGTFLRFATWNIEKSLTMTQAIGAVTSAKDYEMMIDPAKAPAGSPRWQAMVRQRDRLASADIIILQEMDIGVNRSGYLNAAGEMAKALNMNYCYAPQYLEIDPVLLGLQPYTHNDGDTNTYLMAVDSSRYKGVFGSAILSRYPIKNVEVWPLETQPYDWYTGELNRFGPLEQIRRAGASVLFHNTITRELKVGGRNFFRADLHVPGLPGNTLSIINIHLEIKCKPKGRDAQMREILSYIKDIENPLIMAGDHNSAPSDISSTSALKLSKNAATNPYTWTSMAINLGLAFGSVINEGRWVLNTSKNFHSPLATHIPLLLPNPVKPMFKHIEGFQFDDGKTFDFRGRTDQSINGRAAKLSNSNHKDVKGHMTSFSVKRPIGPLGLYRLDWIFVKSFLTDPTDRKGPYRFAPHYGETLVEFNKFLLHPISDHRPCVIDLPLQEPPRSK